MIKIIVILVIKIIDIFEIKRIIIRVIRIIHILELKTIIIIVISINKDQIVVADDDDECDGEVKGKQANRKVQG